jgi:hypothetical protein
VLRKIFGHKKDEVSEQYRCFFFFFFLKDSVAWAWEYKEGTHTRNLVMKPLGEYSLGREK